ncbi:MAG TPA: bi-domain-containing oxidoreductase [Pirellulales bacterium]|nr:bi-domain-containing oxidoreductase [Pirellulales bacterium]
MKQVVQNFGSGVLELLDVPCPAAGRGQLLIQTRASLISAGTERALVEFGRAGLLSKARQSPERVKQVWDKIRAEGLMPTMEAVFAKLDEPMPLGYSNAGVVVEVGPGITQFAAGDRVASNGGHAEMVSRPVNLCAKIPAGVSDEAASFAVLGSIGLQGIRLLRPELGETVAVFGLGLIGLLTVQMLTGSGARVLGIDPDPSRREMAREFGATPIDTAGDVVAAALAQTAGRGVDGVLVTASARDDDILSQAARMSRKRGRIVLVGVVNMELNRAEFYEKELSFQVSCSYGPGRYDTQYEDQGVDYPFAFVRWTEQRNIEAVLGMMEAGRLDVSSLITKHIPHANAATAYELLSSDRSQLGIVLDYPSGEPLTERVVRSAATAAPSTATSQVTVGVIGAGAFTKRVVLPALAKTGARLATIASAGGVTAAHAARKFNFASSTTDYRTILADKSINCVFITARHNSHASMVVEALAAGKHVFVEKPLAITRGELHRVQEAYAASRGLQLMVGFNRRFSPHAVKMRQLLSTRSQPAVFNMLVNAGEIPRSHWTQDPLVGGGRIIGEGCHWIDLLSFLAGSPVVAVQANMLGGVGGAPDANDIMTISMSLADGSIANLHYLANGHRAFPKEMLTVFCQGRVLEMDNFRRLSGLGWPGFKKFNLFRQDKGHQAEIAAFIDRVAEGGPPLIPPAELWNVTEASFAAEEAAADHSRVVLCSS